VTAILDRQADAVPVGKVDCRADILDGARKDDGGRGGEAIVEVTNEDCARMASVVVKMYEHHQYMMIIMLLLTSLFVRLFRALVTVFKHV
jgi:predicted metal-dependent phosphotriesterase family hydrolase